MDDINHQLQDTSISKENALNYKINLAQSMNQYQENYIELKDKISQHRFNLEDHELIKQAVESDCIK